MVELFPNKTTKGSEPLEPLDEEINSDLGEFQSELGMNAHPTACMCG